MSKIVFILGYKFLTPGMPNNNPFTDREKQFLYLAAAMLISLMQAEADEPKKLKKISAGKYYAEKFKTLLKSRIK